MKEITLPSGAVLGMGSTPFAESKALFQAVLEEARGVQVESKMDVMALLKNLLCVGFSSKKIEACLAVCMKRCTYNSLKIEDSVFEPVESRQDYPIVLMAVAEENISPFMKGLYAEFDRLTAKIESFQT